MRLSVTATTTFLLILGFVLIDLFFLKIIDGLVVLEPVVVGVLLGLVVGQVNLISVWAALAVGLVVVRLPWSLMLTLAMYYAIVLGTHIAGQPPSERGLVTLGALLVIGQLAAQLPLWIGSQRFGWRLVSPAQAAGNWQQSDGQFNIKHLFLGMALLALALSFSRIVFPVELLQLENVRLGSRELLLLATVVGCNLSVVVPCVWGAFQPIERMVKLAPIWAAVVVGVTLLQFLLIGLGFGPSSGENFIALLTFNFSQCLTVGGVMLVFRRIDFRLLRTSANAP